MIIAMKLVSMFFSFDGIDGVGKSTQSDLFCAWLREAGHDVVTCRDPGSTPLGERLRDIVLNGCMKGGEELPIARRSEMLLYMAARAQLVEEIIRPALDAGKVVVSDRYLLANIVYQAYAGGLDVEVVRQIGQVATDSIMPDCVLLLDMSEEQASSRMNRELDRMEDQGDEYRRELRKGFLAEANLDRQHIHIIQAAQSIEAVQNEIRAAASGHLSAS